MKAILQSTNPCISVPNGGRFTPIQNGYRVEYFARGKGNIHDNSELLKEAKQE